MNVKYFWIDTFLLSEYTNFLAHGANEYYKTKIWEMSIVEKTQQTRNMRFFDEWSKYIFLVIPPPQWKSEYYFIVHQDNLLFVIVFMIFLQYKIIFCINEWMSSVCEVLLLFWFVVMYLLSRYYDMDGGIKLLADDAWAAEDYKTGFLSVGVDIFYQLYF